MAVLVSLYFWVVRGGKKKRHLRVIIIIIIMEIPIYLLVFLEMAI
jgi:hypothetical protein